MIVDNILLLKINFVETFGYLFTFLATFFEASPLIGLFIPGSVIVFFAGFFAKLGLLNLTWVYILSILGAILGDLASYLFGRYCGKDFLHKYGKYFLIKREYVYASYNLAHEHTGKSLVLGRLHPLTRTAAPFIVGSHKVGFGKFMFFNIIGGVLWGLIFVSLGYAFGQGYKIAEDVERWLIIGTVILIIVIYSRFFIKNLFKKINGKMEERRWMR